MGMKSNSGHFFNTSGHKNVKIINIEINEKNSINKTSKIEHQKEIKQIYDHPTDEKMIKMNKEKQLKHIGIASVNDEKSKMNMTLEETEELIANFSGKGDMISENQEIVDCKKVVGFVEVNGELEPTTLIKIHYSKTGSHAVPYRKGGRKND